MRSRFWGILCLSWLLPAVASAACVGDCDGSGEVTVDEIVTGVAIALGDRPAAACTSLDSNSDVEITVDEIVAAVNAALVGCPPAGPTVLYDRADKRGTTPFPDDFWLTADATQSTGMRLNIPVPDATADIQGVFRAVLRDTNKLDGFSPIAHFVLELSEAPEPTSLPRTSTESLAAGASIGLFDISAGSPAFGQRIPFRVDIRNDVNVLGIRTHSLLIFPSIPLEPRGRYGLVVTRALRNQSGAAFGPSSFFQAVLKPAASGENAAVTQVRALANDVIEAVSQAATAPIPTSELVLAVRVSIRSVDSIPGDQLAIREQVFGATAPAFEITSVTPETSASSPVAAIVRGKWQAPDFRKGLYFARDANGKPMQVKTNQINFTLALPKAALQGPVPITMYQHGNPGSSEDEVPSTARNYMAEAGFAVIGFTDLLNRELSPGIDDEVAAITAQVTGIVFPLLRDRHVPDYWSQLNAEQLAFVHMMQNMGGLDVLPVGAPDGTPDLDVTKPLTYIGISQGSNYAPGLLPYAPEIKAAALVVGGSRLVETLIHQQADAFLTQLGMVFPNMTAADIWAAMSMFQHIFDRQDQHNHGRFMYRAPFEVAGTTRKGSILQIEGLTDSLVPNNASEAIAWQFGPIPHLLPVQRPVPFLQTVEGPVTANINADTTAAFFQYVPVGVEGYPPTPGCVALSERSAKEGHYCAQGAAESRRQRVVFFQTTLTQPAPTIINPFAE